MIRILLLALLLASAGLAGATVNVNQASAAELEVLEGIGPVKAQAIVEFRKRHGPFKSIEELLHVEGIGPATVQRIRKEVSLAGPGEAARVERKDDAKKK